MVGSTSSISKLKMNFLTSYGAEEEDEEAKFDIDDDFNDDDNKEDEDNYVDNNTKGKLTFDRAVV